MMIRRMLAALLTLLLLPSAALAGGGKASHLVPQEGAYSPRYSVSPTFEVLPGKPFEVIVYEDEGERPLLASGNGGSAPAGVSLISRVEDGVRQACITGTVYAQGQYVFSMLVQEDVGGGEVRTLAILHVTLCITADAPTIAPYLGDGQGMVRVVMDGVNFRRTPGGTRLGTFDEDTRLVWCETQDKGGYTWYRVWSPDYGYGWLRGDMVQVEPPLRIVYTPGKETSFPLFITPGATGTLVPSLIMTGNPAAIGFDATPLEVVQRGGDAWTLLRFCIDGEQPFFIQVDLRDEDGVPLECQVIYLTTVWEEVPAYTDR